LKRNQVNKVIDIRLNNSSQLAGFTKGPDLKYFLNEFFNIDYIHDPELAPTKQLLDDYKGKKVTWQQYEIEFRQLLDKRNAKKMLDQKYNSEFDGACLLCSEETADKCHRRLVAEYINNNYPELKIQITHL
jgi:uncharacterized protein (DUF488 family)